MLTTDIMSALAVEYNNMLILKKCITFEMRQTSGKPMWNLAPHRCRRCPWSRTCRSRSGTADLASASGLTGWRTTTPARRYWPWGTGSPGWLLLSALSLSRSRRWLATAGRQRPRSIRLLTPPNAWEAWETREGYGQWVLIDNNQKISPLSGNSAMHCYCRQWDMYLKHMNYWDLRFV